MPETLEQANAMLDLRRAVGMVAAKLGTVPAKWKVAVAEKSLDLLMAELMVAWWKVKFFDAPPASDNPAGAA